MQALGFVSCVCLGLVNTQDPGQQGSTGPVQMMLCPIGLTLLHGLRPFGIPVTFSPERFSNVMYWAFSGFRGSLLGGLLPHLFCCVLEGMFLAHLLRIRELRCGRHLKDST